MKIKSTIWHFMFGWHGCHQNDAVSLNRVICSNFESLGCYKKQIWIRRDN